MSEEEPGFDGDAEGADDGEADFGFEEEDHDEEQFRAAADDGEDLHADSTDDEDGGGAAAEPEPAVEEPVADAEEEAPEVVARRRNIHEKNGWLEQRKMKRGIMTMGRKKATFTSMYFVLKDGKLTMQKMPNAETIASLDVPYCTIQEDFPGPDGDRQFGLGTKKVDYFFQGDSASYVEEWKTAIAAAKKKFRRRSQYGRQTSTSGAGGGTALMF